MEQLRKIVQRQDAFLKLSPSSSNETSINLSTEVSNLIALESGNVTFRLYREDFIKAIGVICNLLPLYYKRSNPVKADSVNEIFDMLWKEISTLFNQKEVAEYTVYHFKRDDNRYYLNQLSVNGFNLRHFLVETHSVIRFIKDADNSLDLRLDTFYNSDDIDLSDLTEDEIIESYDISELRPQQIIYYGAPGTGKSHAIEVATEGQDVIRTTFHPDSDYSTFVGAYKPTSKDFPLISTFGGKAIKVLDENGEVMKENRIVYEFVNQAFLQAYVEAWEKYAANGNSPQAQFLVIEEINRGNCAQIFGDLFQLLDRNAAGFSEYPIKADADMKKQLNRLLAGLTIENADSINAHYKGKDVVSQVLDGDILLLPSNLFIWATMNTSDQSLFPIDSAFKRRWEWRYVRIDDAHKGWKIQAEGKKYDWWDFLEKVNKLIGDTTSSEDKKLGYFFCKTTDGIISAETFVSKVVFYLWNDVFKDYEFEGDIFVDEDKTSKLSFDKFYKTENGQTIVNEAKVDVFLTNLGVEFDDADEVSEDEPEGENEEVASETKRGIAHRQLISVAFPDGTTFDIADGLTHFAVYLEAIKKIGVERAEPIAAASKYHRLNRPVISRERFPEVEADRYSYEQVGDYYLVKGMSNDTYINILNLCSEQLNLGLDVKFRQ